MLFDEVEKAHADVFNVLLSLLDDGRMTDAKGRTVDFKNTIIIMTSNLGSEHLAQAAGAPPEVRAAVRERVMAQVRSFFRPEFLNRLDDVVVFTPLGDAQMLAIARLIAGELDDRLHPKDISLHMSDAALALATTRATAGIGAAYGARPLRRWMEQHIITDLSRMVVAGHLPDSSNVYCDVAAAVAAAGSTAGWVPGGEGLAYRVVRKEVAAGAGTSEGTSGAPNAAEGLIKRSKLLMEPSGSLDMDDMDNDQMVS